MNKELQKKCEEAAKAYQEKALAIVEAMDKAIKELLGDKPTTDR